MKIKKQISVVLATAVMLTSFALSRDEVYASEFVVRNGVLTEYTGKGGRVVLPDNVAEIGDYAFAGSAVTEIVADKVAAVGDMAFSECDQLLAVRLSSGLKSIGMEAFEGCDNISRIIYEGTARDFDSVEVDYFNDVLIDHLYDKNGKRVQYIINDNELIDYNSTIRDVVIPSYVEKIDVHAFDDMDIKTITVENGNRRFYSQGNNAIIEKNSGKLIKGCASTNIPIGVQTIGEYAFSGCREINKIVLPEGASKVCDYAFLGCSKLTSVTFPSSVKSIGKYIFQDTGVNNISMSANPYYEVKENCIIRKSDKTVIAGGRITVIPEGVLAIAEYAFYGVRGIESVSIPEGVTNIGKYAFSKTNLTSVSVAAANPVYRGEGNCVIEKKTNSVVAGCMNSVIPEGAGAITAAAFKYVPLKYIVIPRSVYYIEAGAFDCDIYGEIGSYAETYAKKSGLAFYKSSEASSGIIGDVDGDGRINTKDGILLKRYVAGWNISVNSKSADVNGDGKVNTKDSVILMRYLAGWNITLGV